MKRLLKCGLGILVVMLLVALSAVFAPSNASAAGTTSLTIKKLASDGTTVLAQKTVTWQELAAGVLNDGTSIPIMGDGVTHYYHQGPIFVDDPDPVVQEALRWNPEENFNWYGKDYGALKGTNVKDLCDLVGGMAAGEEVKVLAADGWYKKYAYVNVYEYPSRTGPMVVTWEKNGMTPLTGYNEGMRLVWFAEATWHEATDTSMGDPNPAGMYHVFGNYDWHESADQKYWYYYSGVYPTTTGLSGKICSQLIIYSNEAPPALTADATGNEVGQAVDITFADDAAWRAAVTDVTVGGASISGQYTITAGNLNIASGVFTAAGDYAVVVTATGYSNASVTQPMAATPPMTPPALTADATGNEVGQAVDITFADDAAWRAAVTDVTVGGASISGQYTITAGNLNIASGVFTAAGDYAIVVSSTGYNDASVTQSIALAPPLTPPALTADVTDNTVGQAIDITFIDDAAWRGVIADVIVGGASIAGQYTLTAGNLNIDAGVFTAAGDYEIVVAADGYDDATMTQTMNEEVQLLIPPVMIPDTTNNTVSRSVYKETGVKIDIRFDDDAAWRAAVTGVFVNDTELSSDQYRLAKGKIRIDVGAFETEGVYDIIVRASGYEDGVVIQIIESRKNNKN